MKKTTVQLMGATGNNCKTSPKESRSQAFLSTSVHALK